VKLTVIRLKPNPAGKDRSAHAQLSPSQLAGEWVNFRNDERTPLALQGVTLFHLAYDASGTASWARVMGFTGSLNSGEIVRVHAGRQRDLSVIRPEDMQGAHHHLFTGDDAYIWNNARGDSALLYDEPQRQNIDRAWYAANPPEGVVLVRVGDQLVPNAARAANW